MSVNVCVVEGLGCWHRDCLQEAAVPGGAPLADALRSLPVCCEAGRQARTHLHAHTLARGRSGAGRSPGERSSEMRERGREAWRDGGGSSAESSTFPQSGDLTHGSHTFLSTAADRASALRERRERREREREEGSTLGACKQYGVMEDRQCVSVFACAPYVCVLTCVCLMHQCLTLPQPRLACQTESVSDTQKLAGRAMSRRAEDRHHR